MAVAPTSTGTEAQQDSVLRMLDDQYQPLGATRPLAAAVVVQPNGTSPPRSSGQRLASARDRSSIYSMVRNPSLSDDERDRMRKELAERLTPGARAMPATLQGLVAVANERIEDAIARGQFKNLPRGKIIERDYNASNPFLDTTEYFLNKIIQKQAIVPPWIEKQQELIKATTVFRARLRADWKRHAARTIASQGGSLSRQVQRAEQYAAAERMLTSPVTVGHAMPVETPEPGQSDLSRSDEASNEHSHESMTMTSLQSHSPFRDSSWERTERAYHDITINHLNSLARSYNLMAPDLAKKPYYELDRELCSCFADVAPLLAHEIQDRARVSARSNDAADAIRSSTSLLSRFGAGGDDVPKVYDSRQPHYGFRQFWRDLWRTSSH